MLYNKNLVSDAKNIEMQLHHFRPSNIEEIFRLLNNDNDNDNADKVTHIIAITMFINLYHFIYMPINNILYYQTRNGEGENRKTYINLKNEAENNLSYLYNLCQNSFSNENITMYFSLLNDCYVNDSPIDIHITNKQIIYLMHKHFIKDMAYYLLINYSIQSHRISLMSFMPILKLYEEYYAVYADASETTFITNARITQLKHLFALTDISNLKLQMNDDVNNIRHFISLTTLNYSKILSKSQKTTPMLHFDLDIYPIRKIYVLIDYIIASRYKAVYLKHTEQLAPPLNNFLEQINMQLDTLSRANFPKIFSYNERNDFINFIADILKEPIGKNLRGFPYGNKTKNCYDRITNMYNYETSNSLFPYIFRNGVIEQYSPTLKNSVALYFVIVSLLCLKYELNVGKNKFVIKMLKTYINTTKVHIIDIEEFKDILNV